MRERQSLEDSIDGIRSLESNLDDNLGLIELGEEEGEDDVVRDAEAQLKAIKDELARRQIEALLAGEADANDT